MSDQDYIKHVSTMKAYTVSWLTTVTVSIAMTGWALINAMNDPNYSYTLVGACFVSGLIFSFTTTNEIIREKKRYEASLDES